MSKLNTELIHALQKKNRSRRFSLSFLIMQEISLTMFSRYRQKHLAKRRSWASATCAQKSLISLCPLLSCFDSPHRCTQLDASIQNAPLRSCRGAYPRFAAGAYGIQVPNLPFTISLFRTATSPFSSTQEIPSGGSVGSSKVARSMIVFSSRITRSA